MKKFKINKFYVRLITSLFFITVLLSLPYFNYFPKIFDYDGMYNKAPAPQKIQFDFPYSNVKGEFIETPAEKELRESRKESIRQGFLHAWNGYVKYAWGADELLPLTNKPSNTFNGWGATMVDALDTMWIMGLKEEFKNATKHIANVNFTWSREKINVFETVIRYLGGLLSAYELSGDEVLLRKAKELGEALMPAFNSPSGLPYNIWNVTKGLIGNGYRPNNKKIAKGYLSEIGSLQLEYMKLAQLTGNKTYFNKVQKIVEILDKAKKRNSGFYPIEIDLNSGEFINDRISFGGRGDSFYEYLIKSYIFVGGAIDQYRRMYEESINSMHRYLIKKISLNGHHDLLFIGEYENKGILKNTYTSRMEHLSCFVPGMLAIGAKILNRPKDLEVAIKLEDGCYWAYNITTTGIGPEEFYFSTQDEVTNSYKYDGLLDGTYRMNGTYKLRPETIESLFILYRVTGDKSYQEKGWKIWQSIEKWCKTQTAYSGLYNVTGKTIVKNDNMESFFFAETLKYLYLLFSTPDVISLDDYVFNTEAHPFLRMASGDYFL